MDLNIRERYFINKVPNLTFIDGIQKVVFEYQDELSAHVYRSKTEDFPLISATGKSFFSDDIALLKCAAEACERYSWFTFVPTSSQSVQCTANDLGDRGINPLLFAGLPFSEKIGDLEVYTNSALSWCPTVRLSSTGVEEEVFCPVQILSPSFYNEYVSPILRLSPHEPLLRVPVSTGVAAGFSREDIIYRGMKEIFERDAFMITYFTHKKPVQIDLNDSDLTIGNRTLYDHFSQYQLEAYALYLDTDLPMHTICFLLIDRTGRGRAVSVGLSSDFSVKDAIYASLQEALTLRLFSRINREFTLEVPAVIDLWGRRIFWSKIDNVPYINFLTEGEVRKLTEVQDKTMLVQKSKNNKRKVEYILSKLEEFAYDTYYVSITNREVAHTGLEVGTVVIPRLQPLYLDERIPAYYGERIQHRLYSGKYRDRDYPPHPFL